MGEGVDPAGAPTPSRVADELVRCRRRGLGRLDAVVGSEPAVDLPLLEHLSSLRKRNSPDRGIAVGSLIRDGIDVLSENRPEDARLLTELFFGDTSSAIPVMGPGELLDAAVRRRGVLSEAAFRRERRQVCLRLGRVLLDLAHQAPPPSDPRVQTSASAVLALAQDPAADDELIIEYLRGMAQEFEVGEVFEVIIRFDTPDILG